MECSFEPFLDVVKQDVRQFEACVKIRDYPEIINMLQNGQVQGGFSCRSSAEEGIGQAGPRRFQLQCESSFVCAGG